jgi:hypothetical protein
MASINVSLAIRCQLSCTRDRQAPQANGHARELELQQPAVDAEALKMLDLKRGSAAGPAENAGCS